MNWIQTRSLPVNDEIIKAVMNNPDVTVEDLYALEASVANQYGAASPWIPIILEAEAALVMQETE